MLKHTKRQVNEFCFPKCVLLSCFVTAVCVLRGTKEKSTYETDVNLKNPPMSLRGFLVFYLSSSIVLSFYFDQVYLIL